MDKPKRSTWQFNPVDPGANLSLAKLVSQADWFVDEIVGKAFRRFERYTARRFRNFQAALEPNDPKLARLVIASLYNQARRECTRRRIRYEYERAFDPRSGRQRVLEPEQILQGSNATCLDWALFGASLAVQIKLFPLVIVLVLGESAHAVAAVYLNPPAADRSPLLSLNELLAEVLKNRILAFDCTTLAIGDPYGDGRRTFSGACAAAVEWIRLAANDEHQARSRPKSVCVDIWRAWDLGYHPFSITEVETLRQLLKPIDFSEVISGISQGFVGRQRILREIDNWLHPLNSEPIFWIVGEPGIGKTALAAYLCTVYRRQLAACHFCAHDDEARSSAHGVATSIAFQFSEKLPGYHAWIARLDLKSLLNQEPSTLLGKFILFGVQQAYPTSGGSWLIIIDALDEATQGGTNVLAQFLGQTASRRSLPPGLKFLITSRAVPEVTRALAGIRPRMLDATGQENQNDIDHYLTQKLGDRFDREGIRAIASQSEGIFLYAAYVFDEVKHGIWAGDLPAGVSGWYYRTFDRCFNDTPETYFTHARPLLEIVAAAPAPILRALLTTVTELDLADFQELLDRLSPILVADKHTIRFRHASVRDWLTDGNCAGKYLINDKSGLRLLTDLCWLHLDDASSEVSSYCISYLPDLLLSCGQWGSLVRILLRRDLHFFDRWIDQGQAAKGIRVLETLVGALERGHGDQLLIAGFATQIARLYLTGKGCDEVRPWLIRALKATSWFRGRRLHAIALHEMASLELYQGQHAKAGRLFRAALRMSLWGIPAYHDEAAGNLLALATLSRGPVAVRYGLRALRHAALAEDHRHMVAGGRIVAAGYKHMGEFDKASQHLADALRVAEKHGIALERARTLAERASLTYWSESVQGELQTAQKAYADALREAERVADFYTVLRAKVALGFCALQEGATARAESWLGSLCSELTENNHPELRVHVELGLAAVYHQLGDLPVAADRYRSTILLCEALPTWLLSARVAAFVGLGATLWHSGKTKDAQGMWNDALRASGPLHGLVRMTQANILRCKTHRTHVPA